MVAGGRVTVGRGWRQRELVAWEKNRGWDGWNGLGVKGEQVGGESMQVSDGRGGYRGLEKRKEKKEREWTIALGFGLGQKRWVWVERNGLGLKEMGLGGAMGGIGSGCLQFRFQTLFNVLTLIFSTNIQSIQGQFLQKIDLNTFPYIYDTFSRSKPKKYGQFFNQHFLEYPSSPTFV